MTSPYLRSDIEADEGCELAAYLDTKNVPTIGVGHANGVHLGDTCTQAQADEWLTMDINVSIRALDAALPWWRQMNDARQDVLVMMIFNMGLPHLLEFAHALAAMQAQDYEEASWQMVHKLDGTPSLWATQVGHRAQRLAQQMLTGVRIAP